MNELPDEIINVPIPLVGLTGCQTLHFYLEGQISGKNVVEFFRLQQGKQIQTPTSSNKNISVTTPAGSSPGVKSILDTTSYSSSPSIDPFSSSPSLAEINNAGGSLAQLEDVFKQPTVASATPGSNTSSPALQGWKAQSQAVPMIKVSSIEAGAISNKKEKRPNHADTHIPMGIIKAGWIHKHTVSHPSVLSIFLQWPEDKSPKSIENIFTQIDTVKNNIKHRNIKLIVVVVIGNANIEMNDEKIIQIKKRADIDPKYFLFLNKAEMKVFVKKWEKLVQELADQYYKEECSYTKNQITKSTHPFLVIRYHFKIAFYSELRSDYNQALKYYQFAYNSLKDWKPTNDPRGERFAEVRTIASMINFKIAKLHLWSAANGAIESATSHFDRHIKLFKIYYGPSEKEFTHVAWVAREYQIFGELLEQTPNNPKLVVTQNPSYFYQIAAKYMAMRRSMFNNPAMDVYKRKTNILARFKDQRPRYDLSNYQYIGQPLPDTDHPLELSPSVESADSEIDHDLYRSIANEMSINYSAAIIELLSKAYEQTLIASNHRTLSYIESLIAEEYFESDQYDLAFKYYSKNAVTYRREKWWTLLTHSIYMLLKCVHYLNMPTSYIGYVMDFLSPKLNNTFAERSLVQQNLIALLSDPSKLDPPMALTSSLDVKMEHTHPLLNCRVQFPHSFTFSTNSTEFYVVFESHFPLPIRFSKLHVTFNEPSYNRSISDPLPINQAGQTATKDSERADLLFLPDESRLFTFQLKTKEKMELACTSVILELSTTQDQAVALNFVWNISEWAIQSDQVDQDDQKPLPPMASSSTSVPTFIKPNPYKKFLERSTIRILDHESLIQIKCKHNPPAILNEFYEMEMEILNNDTEITSGTVKFEINSTLLNEKTLFLEPNKASPPLTTLELPHIQEKSIFKKKFYIYSATSEDDSKLVINVSYTNKSNEVSHTSKLFNIPVVIGLTPLFQYFNDHFQHLDIYEGSIISGEPTFLNVDIKSSLPWPVHIKSIQLNTGTAYINVEQPGVGQPGQDQTPSQPSTQIVNTNDQNIVKLLSSSNQTLKSIELIKDNINYSCWFNLLPLIIGESVSFGTMVIEYSRSKEESTVSRLPIQLPVVRVSNNPFVTQVSIPSFGVVGQPLQHSIQIRNNTNFLQEFELVVINPPSYGNTDVPFFFSGEKVSSFHIHPDCEHEIHHTLLPLVAGKHPLPHFKITSKRFNKELTKTKNTNNYLFIKPNLDLSI